MRLIQAQLLKLKTSLISITFSLLTFLLSSCDTRIPVSLNDPDIPNPPSQTTKYTVTFDSGSGSIVQPQTITKGDKVTEPPSPTNPNSSFLFGDWTNSSGNSFDFNTVITSDLTLYAKWIPPITITFDSQNGLAVQFQSIRQGSTATEPTPPTKANRIFAGWHTNQTLGTTFIFDTPITINTTLYAKWKSKVRPTSKSQLITFIEQAISSDGNNANLNFIDTSLITDMSFLFRGKMQFNGDISSWNTSQVTTMTALFIDLNNFNQPIGNWETSNVTIMNLMFNNATSFNQSLNNWNTAKVTDMEGMFNNATSFNQPLNNWNTAKVTDMYSMFYSAHAFNQSLSSWNTSQVTTMDFMFRFAKAFDQNLNKWDTAKVTSMTRIFTGSPIENHKPSWCTLTRCD